MSWSRSDDRWNLFPRLPKSSIFDTNPSHTFATMLALGASHWLLCLNQLYTQFPWQDSGIFGSSPWKVFAPPSNYLSQKGFWATQPLENILWWELGVTSLLVLSKLQADIVARLRGVLGFADVMIWHCVALLVVLSIYIYIYTHITNTNLIV